MLKRLGWLTLLGIFSVAASAQAQGRGGGRGAQDAAAAAQNEAEGIPVQSELVRAKCGSCHRSDDKGRMTRISYRRATPENWERTIKRMATLNKVNLEPADARGVLDIRVLHFRFASSLHIRASNFHLPSSFTPGRRRSARASRSAPGCDRGRPYPS